MFGCLKKVVLISTVAFKAYFVNYMLSNCKYIGPNPVVQFLQQKELELTCNYLNSWLHTVVHEPTFNFICFVINFHLLFLLYGTENGRRDPNYPTRSEGFTGIQVVFNTAKSDV